MKDMQITNSTGSYTIDETEICDDSQGSLDIQNDIAGLYSDENNFIKIINQALRIANERHADGYTYKQWDSACSDAAEEV